VVLVAALILALGTALLINYIEQRRQLPRIHARRIAPKVGAYLLVSKFQHVHSTEEVYVLDDRIHANARRHVSKSAVSGLWLLYAGETDGYTFVIESPWLETGTQCNYICSRSDIQTEFGDALAWNASAIFSFFS